MQPNTENSANPQAAVPNNGGQPYPQTPPGVGQPGTPVQQPVQAIPRSAYEKNVPGSAIPEVMPDESVKIAHKKTVLADGTVLPDVIYVKKRGAIVGFIITTILLVACASYAIYATVSHANESSKIEELNQALIDRNTRLEMTRMALGFNSVDQLTESNIKELLSALEGVYDIDLSTFGGKTIKWLRVSADVKYFMAEVAENGSSSYYYREGNGGWTFGFSRSGVINCRNISADAMRVITELGGVDKSTSSTGKQYDCLDPKDGDKLYDFADAMNAGVHR